MDIQSYQREKRVCIYTLKYQPPKQINIMQTITVNMTAVNNGYDFTVNGNTIAMIRPDESNAGRYKMRCGVFLNGNNSRLPDAIEYVTETIERNLQGWGLNVEFVAA